MKCLPVLDNKHKIVYNLVPITTLVSIHAQEIDHYTLPLCTVHVTNELNIDSSLVTNDVL
jgi:hypothetical protein